MILKSEAEQESVDGQAQAPAQQKHAGGPRRRSRKGQKQAEDRRQGGAQGLLPLWYDSATCIVFPPVFPDSAADAARFILCKSRKNVHIEKNVVNFRELGS